MTRATMTIKSYDKSYDKSCTMQLAAIHCNLLLAPIVSASSGMGLDQSGKRHLESSHLAVAIWRCPSVSMSIHSNSRRPFCASYIPLVQVKMTRRKHHWKLRNQFQRCPSFRLHMLPQEEILHLNLENSKNGGKLSEEWNYANCSLPPWILQTPKQVARWGDFVASQDMTRIQVQRQAVKWTSGRQQGDKSRIVTESGNDPSEIRSHLDRDTNPETKNKSRVRWIHPTKFNQEFTKSSTICAEMPILGRGCGIEMHWKDVALKPPRPCTGCSWRSRIPSDSWHIWSFSKHP